MYVIKNYFFLQAQIIQDKIAFINKSFFFWGLIYKLINKKNKFGSGLKKLFFIKRLL